MANALGLNWYVPLHIAEQVGNNITLVSDNVLIGTYHCILQNALASTCRAYARGLNWYVPLHIAELITTIT